MIADPPKFDPELSPREQLELRTAPDACRGCHQLINPPGFGLHNFDAIGRWRTEVEVAHELEGNPPRVFPTDAKQVVVESTRTQGIEGATARAA